jgi:hypothetical protein
MQHLHWVCAGRIDVPQPAALVTDMSAGLRQMWEAGFETEGVMSQNRVR